MASTMRDVARERRWRDALRRFARSGLGVRAFCGREMLAESAFYFWRREIARRDAEMPKPARPAQRRLPPPAFLPVRVVNRSAPGASIKLETADDCTTRDASIRLELAGGRVLRLPE